MKLSILAWLAMGSVVAAAAVGCGGDDEDDGTAPPSLTGGSGSGGGTATGGDDTGTGGSGSGIVEACDAAEVTPTGDLITSDAKVFEDPVWYVVQDDEDDLALQFEFENPDACGGPTAEFDPELLAPVAEEWGVLLAVEPSSVGSDRAATDAAAAGYTGIRFYALSASGMTMNVQLWDEAEYPTDGWFISDDVVLAPGEWQLVELTWADFSNLERAPEGVEPITPLALNNLYGIAWSVTNRTAAFDLRLEHVAFTK